MAKHAFQFPQKSVNSFHTCKKDESKQQADHVSLLFFLPVSEREEG
jgi:hypothetical protein